METNKIDVIEALLIETESAHGAYETTQLNGVRDEDWASWYAQYAVDHGIGRLLGRSVTAAELAGFFAAGWDAAQRADPPPTDPWVAYTARYIAAEM